MNRIAVQKSGNSRKLKAGAGFALTGFFMGFAFGLVMNGLMPLLILLFVSERALYQTAGVCRMSLERKEKVAHEDARRNTYRELAGKQGQEKRYQVRFVSFFLPLFSCPPCSLSWLLPGSAVSPRGQSFLAAILTAWQRPGIIMDLYLWKESAVIDIITLSAFKRRTYAIQNIPDGHGHADLRLFHVARRDRAKGQ
ncbi:MAG: hypothetical protein ACKV2V_10855 [Blastocatellia bacterium]